jgi:nucleotide-binding universal stress UspA family protein
MEKRIVVATDGQPAAVGALRVARALAERDGTSVEVVSIVPPMPIVPRGLGETSTLPLLELDRAASESTQARVVDQLAEFGLATTWPVTVQVGPPAPSIVRLAQEKHAGLIVLGLGRHKLADRWFGSETALHVARLAHVPVLAVPADADELPGSGVAAIDFTDFSQDAAEMALRILRPGGTLHLVHVFWRPSEEIPWVGGRDWIELQRERMQQQLAIIEQRLASTGPARIERHFLEGDPASELLRFAESLHLGLVAAGSHGAGFLGRLLMGSVSTRLLRGATRMVLIAPPRAAPAEVQAEAEQNVSTAAGESR